MNYMPAGIRPGYHGPVQQPQQAPLPAAFTVYPHTYGMKPIYCPNCGLDHSMNDCQEQPDMSSSIGKSNNHLPCTCHITCRVIAYFISLVITWVCLDFSLDIVPSPIDQEPATDP